MGFGNEKDHRRCAQQFEINTVRRGRAAPDPIQLYHVSAARWSQHGLQASFSCPRPVVGVNGSGMQHKHVDLRGQDQRFWEETTGAGERPRLDGSIFDRISYPGGPSDLNHSVNAYRRGGSAHFEEPNSGKLGGRPRLWCRVLRQSKSRRVEVRSVGGCNPDLVLTRVTALASTAARGREEPRQQARRYLPDNRYDALPIRSRMDLEDRGAMSRARFEDLKKALQTTAVCAATGSFRKGPTEVQYHFTRLQTVTMEPVLEEWLSTSRFARVF